MILKAKDWVNKIPLEKGMCVAVIAALLLLPAVCVPQSLRIINSVADEIKTVSIDRKGYVFYSDGQGNIKKIGPKGKVIRQFSPQRTAKATLIEAWPTLRVFVFYQGPQAYLFLDQFMAAETRYTLDQEGLGFVSMATISNDNGLWLIDDSDYTLKKLDLNFNQITVNTALNTLPVSGKLKVNYMREYQNRLFVNDSTTGILVFDSFGNYLKTLPFKGLSYFNFLGEELYFLKEGMLHFFHLYNLKERTVRLPGKKTYSYALITTDYFYLISDKGIDIAKVQY